MRNLAIATGIGAAVGAALFASFRFSAGTVTRLVTWVCQRRNTWREKRRAAA